MNDEVYALKVQKKRQLLDNKRTKAVIREAAIIKSLDHPFVLSLLNVYHNEHEVFFVTNFIQGGELKKRLFNLDGEPVALPPNDARFYAAGVLEGEYDDDDDLCDVSWMLPHRMITLLHFPSRFDDMVNINILAIAYS